MKYIFRLNVIVVFIWLISCTEDDSTNQAIKPSITINFSHNWNGTPITDSDFNIIKFTNQNGEMLSINRLRYVISDLTFTTTSNEVLNLDNYNLIDLTNNSSLTYSINNQIPSGNYSNVTFTFGFDNDDNAQNYVDLNSVGFNVPETLGGGYHYMQLDGQFVDSNNQNSPYNYHAIRAVDNPGANPTFPQDTFFTVTLGPVSINSDTSINISMDVSEWFKNPNIWDLNQLNTNLMANSTAQIQMFQNGQSVFSLESISQ